MKLKKRKKEKNLLLSLHRPPALDCSVTLKLKELKFSVKLVAPSYAGYEN
jgi:hypothetical protein